MLGVYLCDNRAFQMSHWYFLSPRFIDGKQYLQMLGTDVKYSQFMGITTIERLVFLIKFKKQSATSQKYSPCTLCFHILPALYQLTPKSQ